MNAHGNRSEREPKRGSATVLAPGHPVKGGYSIFGYGTRQGTSGQTAGLAAGVWRVGSLPDRIRVQCVVTSRIKVALNIMSVRTRFGLWTLFAGIAWVAGLIAAGIVIWHLWTDWYPR